MKLKMLEAWKKHRRWIIPVVLPWPVALVYIGWTLWKKNKK